MVAGGPDVRPGDPIWTLHTVAQNGQVTRWNTYLDRSVAETIAAGHRGSGRTATLVEGKLGEDL